MRKVSRCVNNTTFSGCVSYGMSLYKGIYLLFTYAYHFSFLKCLCHFVTLLSLKHAGENSASVTLFEWWIMLYEPTLLLCVFYINNEFQIIIAYLKNKVKVILDCFLVLRLYSLDFLYPSVFNCITASCDFIGCYCFLVCIPDLRLIVAIQLNGMKTFRALRSFFTWLFYHFKLDINDVQVTLSN